MQTNSAKNKPSLVYIIDYDIPIKPLRKRRAFYRLLEKIKEEMSLFGKMSTMSVLVTLDRQLAEKVYRLASQYGEANIYIGRKLDEDDE